MLQVKFVLACENSHPSSLPAQVAFSRNAPRAENRFLLFFKQLALNSESSIAVTLLLHADCMIVKNVSNQGGETA